MKNNVIYAANRFLNRPKAVTAIIASLEKNVSDLMATAQKRADLAINADARAQVFQEEAETHRVEAERALRVAERIGGLIS